MTKNNISGETHAWGGWGILYFGTIVVASMIIIVLHLEAKRVTEMNDMHVSWLREAKQTSIDRKVRYKKALIDWVYNSSDQIDYVTATEIVNATLSTNHPILILSVIKVESSFNPMAVSKKGAVGLGQIMYGSWGKNLEAGGIIKSKRDLFGVRDNICATEYVLNVLMEESNGDVVVTLKKYLGASKAKYKHDVFSNYVRLSMLRED